MSAPDFLSVPVGVDAKALPTGHRDVEAIHRSGPFAIHRSVNQRGFTVTHVASGYALASGLCCEHNARDLADTVQRLPIDWSFASVEQRPQLPEDVLSRLRKIVAEAKA